MKSLYLSVLLALCSTTQIYSKTVATLSEKDATALIDLEYTKQEEALKAATLQEVKDKKVTFEEFVMPYDYITYGEEPKGGHSLYIAMHGGGGAPASVNDGQWRGMKKLYKPAEGIYLAPRAPTNTWNLWHEPHIDPMFDAIIERFIAHNGVNPNKVYLSGYSAGGDGAYQLAPRMADRWAAAAMMAGHPGGAKKENLLNLPFFIQCGELDKAYNRNKKARNWGTQLDELEKENPGFYPHKWIVYPKHAHWMKLEDKQAFPWMAKYTRNPWPKKMNWHQNHVTHTRFYWLANENPAKNDFITAEVNDQTITLSTENVPKITLRLNDALIDLDKAIIVKDNKGKELFKGIVPRTKEAIEQSLKQRLDKTSVATALLEITL